jgi:hypothetical protein
MRLRCYNELGPPVFGLKPWRIAEKERSLDKTLSII